MSIKSTIKKVVTTGYNILHKGGNPKKTPRPKVTKRTKSKMGMK